MGNFVINSLTVPIIISMLFVWGVYILPTSGKEMLKLFLKSGWSILRRKGSHVQIGKDGKVETIPQHKELAKGLEKKLLKRLNCEK